VRAPGTLVGAVAGVAICIQTLTAISNVPPGVPSRDPNLQALVSRAASTPPEFAADLLLRIAASPRIADAGWKRELIDEAYIRALSAQESFPRTAPFAPPDTTAAAQTLGYQTGLDRMSLQARAAVAMAAISAPRAREMFEWIDVDLPEGTCEEPLVPALDLYYETLATLARSTFGVDADARADALWFLEIYLWRANRPSEMASLTRAVLRYRPSSEEAPYLENLVSRIFRYGVPDPRAFSTSAADLLSRAADLDTYGRRLGVNGSAVLRGLRGYLVQQARGPRCGDSIVEGPIIDSFNRLVVRRNMPDLDPITARESRPSRILGAARLERLWHTADARSLRDRAAVLQGTPRRPVPESVKREPAWQEQADGLLTDIEQWTGSREPVERDYLYQKGLLLSGLTEIAPPGVLRTRALHATLNFLRHDNSSGAGRNLWFTHASRVLDLARGEDREEVLETLVLSGEPVISLYAQLAAMRQARRAAPRRAPETTQLWPVLPLKGLLGTAGP
jgi:hypothetical protein